MFKSKITGKRQITIPAEVFNNMKLNIGDFVGFKKEGNSFTLIKIENEENNTCCVCKGSLSTVSQNLVNIYQKNYHIECWFNLSDIEKVKYILYKHNISEKDCEKLLKITNHNLNPIIDIYYNNLENINTENIALLIIDLLNEKYKISK